MNSEQLNDQEKREALSAIREKRQAEEQRRIPNSQGQFLNILKWVVIAVCALYFVMPFLEGMAHNAGFRAGYR